MPDYSDEVWLQEMMQLILSDDTDSDGGSKSTRVPKGTKSSSSEIYKSNLEEKKLDFIRSKHTRLLASAKHTS
jgi:hypothetical protein